MMKRLFVFLLLIGVLFSFVSGELGDSGEQLQGTLENVSNTVDKTRDVIDNQKFDSLGAQWQELLLKNRIIGSIDEILTLIDPLFVVLFARHYSFSVTLFFAFLMWLFTLIWATQAARALVRSEFFQPLMGLIFTVLLAHLQIFNKLSEVAFKILFYKSSPLWSFMIFILLIVLLVVYLYAGRILAKYLKQARNLREQRELQQNVKNLETKDKAVQSSLK